MWSLVTVPRDWITEFTNPCVLHIFDNERANLMLSVVEGLPVLNLGVVNSLGFGTHV